MKADELAPPRPTPPPTVLRGPANADNFRVKVGRYGDRWYCDPLPGDDIAPASPDDEAWPSITFIKKASGQDWSFVSLKRVAHSTELPDIAKLDRDARYERLKIVDKLEKNRAFARGTNVHTFAECLLYGAACPLGPEAVGANYFPAVQRFFDDYQPELVAAEFVAIHRDLNGVGYGGTSDALVNIALKGGRRYIIDWKSRGEDSDHGAYPEEAAQLGAYWGAQYIIVEGASGAKRQALPAIDGGLIVSIKPDSYEVHPVDLQRGFDHFTALHAWWAHRQDERKCVGRKWGPATKAAVADAPSLDRTALLERYQQLDDDAKERFVALGIPKDDLAAIDAALTELENPPTVIDLARERMQRDAARKATADAVSNDDEGGPASEADVNTVAAFALIEPERAAWCGEIVKQGIAAGHDFRVSMKATQRRADLCIAVGLWAQGKYWDPDDDEPLRAAIYAAVGDHAAFWPTLTPGAIVGQIDAAGARTLRAVMNHIDQDELVAVADEDTKTLRWQTRRPVA